ncbi:hypothetical protein QBC45DRAFT_336824 [Copromyces sp. CBS 386.78]|nr:hypothetical protein QBC45DRAFT_336824 [Copromyces sp. CBS 386.78]
MPDLQDEEIVQAIASAPSSTVRTVLRALCADEETKLRIGMFLSQLPVTYEQRDQSRQGSSSSSSSSASRKRKTAPQIEICVQCESPFEEGDESLTCQHHPYDMEIDFDSEFWADCGHEYDDTPFWREQNPDGFTFPCCGETGSSVDEGCTMGKHRAADGKRGRYEYSKNPNGMAATLEAELRARERTGNPFL